MAVRDKERSGAQPWWGNSSGLPQHVDRERGSWTTRRRGARAVDGLDAAGRAGSMSESTSASLYYLVSTLCRGSTSQEEPQQQQRLRVLFVSAVSERVRFVRIDLAL